MHNMIGCDMPDFIVQTIDDEVINAKELRNKVVVINFWFKSCTPCIAELPELNKLVDKYESENVVFLGFTRDSKSVVEKDFLPKYEFKYKLIPIDNEIIEKFAMYFGWPTNMVFAKNGKLKTIFAGGRAKDEVYNMLKPIIDKCLTE